jgi:hypothetical protein
MRLKTTSLSRLTNFLLGAAWAIALIGAVTTFKSFFIDHNFIIAILSAMIGSIPGLLIVIFLEHLFIKSEKLEELKKQTKLLEQLVQNGTAS